MFISFYQKVRSLRGVIFTIPTAVVAISLIRLLGWLQPVELAALDLFFQLRPTELPDSRFLIVAVEEEDLQSLQQWPISDKVLAQLLTQIKKQRPTFIGLDIYRDLPVEPGHQELVEVFKTTPNLIGIQKTIGDTYSSKIAPSPVLKEKKQVSANDIVVDGDGVIRRAILFPMAENEDPSMPSLGLSAALYYLEKHKGITPIAEESTGFMKLGKKVFPPFRKNDGGYINSDDGSYQILMNYRGRARSFPKVSLTDVLENRIPSNLMRDRIVLIGAYAPSLNDLFYTPYSSSFRTTPIRTPGVEVQANLASQILSSVLDNRSLIKVWYEEVEYFWLILWVTLTATWVWFRRNPFSQIRFSLITIAGIIFLLITLISISYGSFLAGWWIPLIPSLLGILGTSLLVGGYNYVAQLKSANAALNQLVEELGRTNDELQQTQDSLLHQIQENQVLYASLEEANQNLESKVEERTLELVQKTTELEQVLSALKKAQKQMVAQEKLASLGALTAGVAHEIQNPLNFVNNYALLCLEYFEELSEEVEQLSPLIPETNLINIQELITLVTQNVSAIAEQGTIASSIVRSMLLHARQENSHPALIELNTLVEEAIGLVSHSIPLSSEPIHISFQTHLDATIGQIEAISEALNRALVNLLNNSYYAVSSKAKMESSDFLPKITVTTKNHYDQVEICISDNGTGIPQDILDQIFHPFFTTKPPGDGTGLGLSLTHDIIVGQHRGEIQVETIWKEGTHFLLRLPKKFIG